MTTPLWVTARSNGNIGATPVTSLQVNAGPSIPVSWSDGLGMCPYPLSTSVCATPGPQNVTAGSTITETSPPANLGLLPSSVIPLSNVVTSQTCIHFVAMAPNGLLSLASVRPNDLDGTSIKNIVWSTIPVPMTVAPHSIFIGMGSQKILVTFYDATGINYCYYGDLPDNRNNVAQTPSVFQQIYRTPGLTGTILAAKLLLRPMGSQSILVPLLVIKTTPSQMILWSPAQGPDGTPLINGVDNILPLAVERAIILDSLELWLAGSSAGNCAIFHMASPQDTAPTPYVSAVPGSFTTLSATPLAIYAGGDTGLHQYDLTTNAWSSLSSDSLEGLIADLWTLGNPWIPATPPPQMLGVHVIRTKTIASTTVLVAEHLSMATMSEQPIWAPDSFLPPTPRTPPIWDDRVLFDPPLNQGSSILVQGTQVIPSPPLATITTGLDRVDPSGALIININSMPNPDYIPNGFILVNGPQVYRVSYPTTKLQYPALLVTAPKPALAQVTKTMFPPATLQTGAGKIPDPTLTLAFKAIQSGGQVCVSVIANNATGCQIGTDATILPPILTDYPISVAIGQTSVSLQLLNQDHTVSVTPTSIVVV